MALRTSISPLCARTLQLYAKPILRTNSRTLRTTASCRAEGDTGAPRAGGAVQSDAFTRREQASEGYYVRQHEAEQLADLKQSIAVHEAQLAELKDRTEAIRLMSDTPAPAPAPGGENGAKGVLKA